MISLVLPVPPSVNAAYRNVRGRGRVKTQAYHDWIESAGHFLMQQRWQKVDGSYALEIKLSEKIRCDIDNRIKLVSDLLVSIKAVTDDKHAWKVSVERSPEVNEYDCYVTVMEWREQEHAAA